MGFDDWKKQMEKRKRANKKRTVFSYESEMMSKEELAEMFSEKDADEEVYTNYEIK